MIWIKLVSQCTSRFCVRANPKPRTWPSFTTRSPASICILGLLAGIDLLTGKVHARVVERYRSREFVSFIKLLDSAYAADTAIKLILDNHPAHVMAGRPARGPLLTRVTPKHGS